jgi:hypothetical protein
MDWAPLLMVAGFLAWGFAFVLVSGGVATLESLPPT